MYLHNSVMMKDRLIKNQRFGRRGLVCLVIDWRWQLDQRRLPPSLLLLTRTVQDCMQRRAGPPISAAMKGLIIHNRKYYNLNINCTLLSRHKANT